jgi:NTE family protein
MARFLSGNLVGLALGSGAAFGLAHIGVLKVLERERIPVDIIAGSSIGALIGSMYAVGMSVAEIEKAALEIDIKLLVGRLADVSLFPVRGLMHGTQAAKHFKKHLGTKTFEHCRIPLKVTGANLTTRQSFVFDSGPVSDAVRASIAIPAIFKPVMRGNDVIVDGGILNPLPVHVLRQSGANKIIAVNVFPTTKDLMEKRLVRQELAERSREQATDRGWFSRVKWGMGAGIRKAFVPNIFDILVNTIQSMEAEIADIEGQGADVLLRPVIPNSSWSDFFKPAPFIKRGEEETIKLLPKIKALVSLQREG